MHFTNFLKPSMRRRLGRTLMLACACALAPGVLAQGNLAPVVQLGVGEMFIQSHIVVKAVMVFLALLSLLTWMAFLEKLVVFGRARKANAQFLEEFRRAALERDLPGGNDASAMGRMWLAARDEIDYFRKTHTTMPTPHQADRLLQRIALAAGIVQERELSRLSTMMGVLATIGSTSPFIGLFGTVWGIYHALTAIGVAGQASIDKVAGPVGEALIMTAFGLAVAIPAVLGYNALTRNNKTVLGKLNRFAHQLHSYFITGTPLTRNKQPLVKISHIAPKQGGN